MMQMMKTRIAAHCRRAFTLVELITAMAITAVLVIIIMQLTNHSISLWKVLREDTSSSATARLALQTISRDFEAFQMRTGNNNYQWFFAEMDNAIRGVPRGLAVPRSARCIFFTCVPDRNPAVSSNPPSMRAGYRNMLATSDKYQGDVSAVGYRLLFRDHILNLAARSGDKQSFPLFSLYRQVISPRETFDTLLCKEDLQSAYGAYQRSEENSFLCENIIEMSIILNLECMSEGNGNDSNTATYRTISVPILSSNARRGMRSFRLYSNHAQMEGETVQNARIVSAELSMTVLTEEGVALVEQVRQGQRRAPKLEEFFSRYTRSFSRSVSLPLPL